MADYVELYIDQGADFESTIVLQDDVTNLLQNVEGYVVTGTMRRSLLSPNTSGTLVCTITDTSSGEILISMNASNTANLRTGTHLFDIKTRINSKYERLIEGIIIVTPSITK